MNPKALPWSLLTICLVVTLPVHGEWSPSSAPLRPSTVTRPAAPKSPAWVRLVASTKSPADIAAVEHAKRKGARLVSADEDLLVLEAPPELADSLPLARDVIVYALDVDANAIASAAAAYGLGLDGTGVRIAVLDTGYDYTHPDLASSYLGGRDIVNFDDDPMDDNGHGTAVAGLITSDGITNPLSTGIAPGAGIIAIKILNDEGVGFMSRVASGIRYTVNNFTPHIISISIGSFDGGSASPCDFTYYYIKDAVDYARENGVLVVAAAGNTGQDVTSPGCVSGVITVGAVDKSLNLTSFTARGPLVEIFAPGNNLMTAAPGGGSKFFSGTSAAAPLVSGALALLVQARPNANLPELEEALIAGARPVIDKNTHESIKVLDVAGALQLLGTNRPPQPAITVLSKAFVSGLDEHVFIAPADQGVTLLLDASGSSDPDGDTLTFTWLEADNLLGTGPLLTKQFFAGHHDVRLEVNDGALTASRAIEIDVISPEEAVAMLAGLVAESSLSDQTKRMLLPSLNVASAALAQHRWRQGINQLEVFQHKLLAQVAKKHPALAEVWIEAAQSIVETLSQFSENRPNTKNLRVQQGFRPSQVVVIDTTPKNHTSIPSEATDPVVTPDWRPDGQRVLFKSIAAKTGTKSLCKK